MMRTILLVEDNELNRDMLQPKASRSGFCVVTAADGPEGIRNVPRGAAGPDPDGCRAG